jgi:hypothetical protein
LIIEPNIIVSETRAFTRSLKTIYDEQKFNNQSIFYGILAGESLENNTLKKGRLVN